MAYKVGTTIVIDDSGNVDWSRIANKPAAGVAEVSVGNTSPSGGIFLTHSLGQQWNCNCVQNCYVESLTGGGSSGIVSVSAVRRSFNCNCNCNCRC